MVNSRVLSIFLTVALFVCTSLHGAVTLSHLENEIIQRLNKVEPFLEIKKIASQSGIKEVYLFGGTASAWAHYVYADLTREDGSTKYFKDHFDYDYTSIFRSNQDMDIAIDGTPLQAAELEKKLTELFPFFQGNKTVFEVRLLHSSRGDKDAIIGNPDFLNQNNDTHSTGLIELYGDGKKVIQDVKDLNSLTPQFINDVYERKLHFYYNHDLHIMTKRFKEGKNPEIIAVLRYLTKAFQYELNMDRESLQSIATIIGQFNPTDLKMNDPYVASWLERNGPKLIQNAVNVEYAWDTLQQLGLRKKLMEINNNPAIPNTLAWWLSREPLRSMPLGILPGVTAKDLGLDIVAHETRSFEAYESITKSHYGMANVFISRGGSADEAAIYGDGFYVKIGREGARGTGLTIRFHLDPRAVLNVDFMVHDTYLRILNKNAIRVISESLSISPYEYFSKLAKKELIFDASDKGVQEKVRRKVGIRSKTIQKEEMITINKLLDETPNYALLVEMLDLAPQTLTLSPIRFFKFLQEKRFEEMRDHIRIGKLIDQSFNENEHGPLEKSLVPFLHKAEGSYLLDDLFFYYFRFKKKNISKDVVDQFFKFLETKPEHYMPMSSKELLLSESYAVHLSDREKKLALLSLLGKRREPSNEIKEFFNSKNSQIYLTEMGDLLFQEFELLKREAGTFTYNAASYIKLFSKNSDWSASISFVEKLTKVLSKSRPLLLLDLYFSFPEIYQKETKAVLSQLSKSELLQVIKEHADDFSKNIIWKRPLEEILREQLKSDPTFAGTAVVILSLPIFKDDQEFLPKLISQKHLTADFITNPSIFNNDFFQNDPKNFIKLILANQSNPDLSVRLGWIIHDAFEQKGKTREAKRFWEHLVLDSYFTNSQFLQFEEYEKRLGKKRILLPTEYLVDLETLQKRLLEDKIRRVGLQNPADTIWLTQLHQALLKNESSWAELLKKTRWSALDDESEFLILAYLKYFGTPEEIESLVPRAITEGRDRFKDFAQYFVSTSKASRTPDLKGLLLKTLRNYTNSPSCNAAMSKYL